MCGCNPILRNVSNEHAEIRAPKTLFKVLMFLLCNGVAAGSACVLVLKLDLLSFCAHSWVYLLILVVAALLTVLAGMIGPKLYGNRSTRDALRDSLEKIQVLAKFLFPVVLFYGDLMSDILMIWKFASEGKMAFAVMNTLAILAGSTASVVNSVHDVSQDSLLLSLMIFLQLTPLTIALQSIGLFCAAVNSSPTDPRYKSLEGYLRDEGCQTLLQRAIVGEAFTESLLSTFLQTYALLQHSVSWSSLTIVSLFFSVGSIVKSFAKVDLKGHVSRELKGQGIVVGLADWSSIPFILVVLYRLAEVTSQVLFFPLFQLIRDSHGVIFGLRCSGVILWMMDLAVQAALVYYGTGNITKLQWAVPNTIGVYEPMLIAGSGALLTISAKMHVLTHFLELVLATGFVCCFYMQRVNVVWEEHSRILCCFAMSNLAKYVLFAFVRKFCAYQPERPEEFPIQKILKNDASASADLADKRAPLEVAMSTALSVYGADPQKLFDAMKDDSTDIRKYYAGEVCHLVSRLAQGKDIKKKESLMDQGAGDSVLAAIDMHLEDDESDDCPVLRGACRALMNLTTGSAKNKQFFAEKGPGMMLNCMLKDSSIRAKLVQQDILGPVVSNLKAHGDDNLLQTATCGDSHLREKLVQHHHPCTNEVLASMRKHPDDMDVQRNACSALRNLAPASDRETQLQLLAMGVREDIRKAMDHHASQPSVVYEAQPQKSKEWPVKEWPVFETPRAD
ncbi:aarA [Symbiodinium natans]|uniref:AarA protein n=1 Tax=Symbiodinium natans TaxID=878477 RepID=A0A812RH19_9DINO|nr:aarA [Symbiodinium natans]